MTLGPTFSWAFLVLIATTGSATTRTVDNSGTCGDASCAPCCTIQAAIEKSSGGDIVSVADGTYPETLDFRDMASSGDITLKAASTPGNVVVSSNGNDPAIHHQDGSSTYTVTIEGLTLSSVSAEPCLWIGHTGATVLRDVTANSCDYTALLFKESSSGPIGDVTLERVTANNAAVKEGIRIVSASSVTLTDCTTNSNPDQGVVLIDIVGAVEITNHTAENNGEEGIDLNTSGPLTITGATLTDNGRAGIEAVSTSTIQISASVVTGSGSELEPSEGLRLEGQDAINTLDSVTLTGLQSNSNWDNGVSLANIAGPVTLTDCTFEDNGSDGVDIWDSVLGELATMGGLVITDGHATGNDDRGYRVRATGDAAVDGAQADTNDDRGFSFELTGIVSFEDCSASGNGLGEGIRVESFASDDLDEVTITDCTANGNGLVDGGNGIYVKEVTGPVTITSVTANGNSRTNIRVDSTAGEVLISNAVANSSPDEEGIKIDVDVGPVTVENSTVDGNALEGIVIRKEDVDVETVTLTENSVTNNTNTGISLSNLSATGTFDATCNDITGNGNGMYHDSAATVDARYIWWGEPSGPSGKGSGSGDSVWYEPGGTILFDPWLEESCTGCNGVVNLTLANDSVITTETHKSCYSITAGPNYMVYGPSGDLTLTARQVMFIEGFSVGDNGSLTIRHQ